MLNLGYYNYKIVLAYLFRGKKVIYNYIKEMEANKKNLVIIYSNNLSLVIQHWEDIWECYSIAV